MDSFTNIQRLFRPVGSPNYFTHNTNALQSLGTPLGIFLKHSSTTDMINDLTLVWMIYPNVYIFVNIHIRNNNRSINLVTGSPYLFSDNILLHNKLKHVARMWKESNPIHQVKLNDGLLDILHNLIGIHKLNENKFIHKGGLQLIWSYVTHYISMEGTPPEPVYNTRWNYPDELTSNTNEVFFEGPINNESREAQQQHIYEITDQKDKNTNKGIKTRFSYELANSIGEMLLYYGIPKYINDRDPANISTWHMVEILKWSNNQYYNERLQFKHPYYPIISKPFGSRIQITWNPPEIYSATVIEPQGLDAQPLTVNANKPKRPKSHKKRKKRKKHTKKK